ncbi:MAG TPA: hypothetical protein VIK39_18495 [Candidatus Angelobacter sp.]
MAVCCFQPGHEQGKHNAGQRDQANHLSALELTFTGGVHWRLRCYVTPPYSKTSLQ